MQYPPSIRSRIRRQIRRITPGDAHRILGHDRYWTRPFFEEYLELCDETAFQVPQDGYQLARIAPDLANRIPDDPERFGFYSIGEKRDAMVRALAVRASACRAAGWLGEAEDNYDHAFRLAEQCSATRSAVVDLQLRYAVLLTTRHDPRAFTLADDAVAFYERAEDRADLACALVIRGTIRTHTRRELGLPDYLRACSLGYPRKGRCQRAYLAALTNSLYEMAHARVFGLDTLEVLLQHARQALRSFSRKPITIPKATLTWIEGLLHARLGISRIAERRLERARASFRSLEEPVDLLLASLDLALLYLQEGEKEKLAKLSSELRGDIESYGEAADLDTLATAWRRALPSPTEEELRELRASLASRRA